MESTTNPLPLLVMLATLIYSVALAHAFYLPGVAPHDYVLGDLVPLHVNALSAEDSLISYDYYHPEFHFCQPKNGPVAQRESLGAILFGDRLFDSPFEITALKSESCKALCTAKIPAKDTNFIHERYTCLM